jgi:hypothetical protein
MAQLLDARWSDQMNDQRNYRKQQQEVDQTARNVEHQKPSQPKNGQDCE